MRINKEIIIKLKPMKLKEIINYYLKIKIIQNIIADKKDFIYNLKILHHRTFIYYILGYKTSFISY